MLIQPFPGWRPRPELAERISAPPYDVINRAEAARMAAGNPHSFLHVSKAEIGLEESVSPYDPIVYQTARNRFEAMKSDGKLIQDAAPSLYIYRLSAGGHEQVGLAAAVAVDAYLGNRVLKHELTRPDKEDDRTRFAEALSANAGPVFLTYRKSSAIDQLIAQGRERAPVYDFVADDGVAHTLWVVNDAEAVRALCDAFEALPQLYVADGHHRSAAASRVCQMRRAQGGQDPQAGYNRFLAVCFPDDQVDILEYNRVVRDLGGLSARAFLERVEERFIVTPAAQAVQPQQPRTFGLRLGEQWFALTIREELVDASDPVARLDVSLLQDNLLGPILDIQDPRRDPRIDFVGGIRGTAELERRVASGEMAAGFSLHPTALADLMAVSDAGRIMPPKSTWFEPKLRDGLLVQEI